MVNSNARANSSVTRLNCLGMRCPLPLISLKVCIDKLLPGQLVEMQGDDSGTYQDLPHWCELTGHKLISLSTSSPEFTAVLEKIKSK